MKKVFILTILFFAFFISYAQKEIHYDGLIKNCKYCSDWDTPPLYVYLDLVQNNNKVKGTYYYKHVGTKIKVKGKIEGDSLFLEEFHNHKITGFFKAKFVKNSLNGFWFSADKKKKFPFESEKDNFPTDYQILCKTTQAVSDCMTNSVSPLILQGNLPENTITKFNKFHALSFDENHCEEGEMPCHMSTNTISSVPFKNTFFISTSQFESNYFCGAGADNHINYYVFDIQQSKILSLKDLLSDKNIEVIRGLVNEEISFYFDGDEYNLERFLVKYNELERLEDFYFTEDGIAFFLAAPGAMTNIIQMEDIEFSYEKIKKLLKKDNAIYFFVKKHH